MQSRRKQRVGRVLSDKMDKTAVVGVETRRRHRLYPRQIRRTSRFKVHDERNEAQVGDVVRIEESRPISKEKHWRLVEIIQRAGQPIEIPVDVEEAS